MAEMNAKLVRLEPIASVSPSVQAPKDDILAQHQIKVIFFVD